MKTRVHIWISGKVQGVFFRSRTVAKAYRLRVTGWVKNLPDGRVEAVFEGEEEAVQDIISFCKKGPLGALVQKIKIKQEAYIGEYKGFTITY